MSPRGAPPAGTGGKIGGSAAPARARAAATPPSPGAPARAPAPGANAVWQALATRAGGGEGRREAEANAVAATVLGPERSSALPSAPAPLPSSAADGVRRQAGALLGRDFSPVRLHHDGAAGRRAAELGAHAFASGGDVYFAPGRFRPDLALGRALIAHELTHVAQQGAAPRRGNAVVEHVRAGAPSPALYRGEIEAFRGAHPAGSIAEGRAALREPFAEADVTPAPPGMSQRCVEGCQSCRGGGEKDETGAKSEKDAGAPEATTTKAAGPGATGGAKVKDPQRVVRLAWTFDDGPTTATNSMEGAIGAIPGTWFVMRNQLRAGGDEKKALAALLDKQKKGSEIGIHAFHPDKAHHAWYPVTVAAAVPQAYNSVDDAMVDLTTFTGVLRAAGIDVKFVRMPGGEVTELQKHLEKLGDTDGGADARKILKGESVTGTAATTGAADYQKILSTLGKLGLVLWGGSATGPMIKGNSWEAEAEPANSPLTNDVMQRFKGTVNAVAKDGKPHSLIILAHDTAKANADAIKGYIADMDAYAVSKDVGIEFYTMSGLHQAVRGTAP